MRRARGPRYAEEVGTALARRAHGRRGEGSREVRCPPAWRVEVGCGVVSESSMEVGRQIGSVKQEAGMRCCCAVAAAPAVSSFRPRTSARQNAPPSGSTPGKQIGEGGACPNAVATPRGSARSVRGGEAAGQQEGPHARMPTLVLPLALPAALRNFDHAARTARYERPATVSAHPG